MDSALNLIFSVLFLIILVWVGIFGSVGAMMSRSRGGRPATGFMLGVLLGPLGLLLVLWLTRASRQPVDAATWLDGDGRDSVSAPSPREAELTAGDDTGGHYF